jgi:hypothetical protein
VRYLLSEIKTKKRLFRLSLPLSVTTQARVALAATLRLCFFCVTRFLGMMRVAMMEKARREKWPSFQYKNQID